MLGTIGVEKFVRQIASLYHESLAPPAGNATRSVLEEFATPRTFTPRLTLPQAIVALVAALCRIFLSCFTFAVWGVCVWTTWDTIPNIALRVLAILPQILLFLVSLAVLELAITSILKRLWPKLQS